MSRERKGFRVRAAQVLGFAIVIAIIGGSIFLVFGQLSSGTDCNTTVNKTNCVAYGCIYIKDASGNTRAIMDGGGFVDLRGAAPITGLNPITSDGGDFIIKDAAGNTVAMINGSDGRLLLRGTILADNANAASPIYTCDSVAGKTAGAFVVKNNTGNCTVFINSTGHLWAKGEVCYRSKIT